MPDIIVKQEVAHFPSDKFKVEQKIIIDVNDNWVFVQHNGETLSMSVSSFLELQSLSSEALKQYKSLK